ncbi:hypothetical protein [Streptomyces rhizosphaerihabitans]|uniref:hypothetical protein n=1 Tax=Streptomyces rhizosphaerihabitans TaxID=1266770 RepID=UPI0021BFFB4F|nr:hypothetical protein [Streptomyces rhizosphaerihabitans]MCT9006192.1 hypothetical protein [Streptomyces rhizosphaerihabitans]
MKRFARPRTGAAAVVSVLSLALVTGCSDSGSGSGSDDKDSGKGSASATKPLGDSELGKLIITTADAKGFKVSTPGKADAFAASKKDVKVVDEKCAPLAYVLTGLAPGDSASYVSRMAHEDPTAKASASPTKDMKDMSPEELEKALSPITDALGSTTTIVSLSSYEGDGAKETMSSVSAAIEACGGGFTVTAEDEPQKFSKVVGEKASGNGDESVAFAATGDAEGSPLTVHAEVARHGSTVATYYSLNLAALAGDGKAAAYSVPAALIEAQTAKLG